LHLLRSLLRITGIGFGSQHLRQRRRCWHFPGTDTAAAIAVTGSPTHHCPGSGRRCLAGNAAEHGPSEGLTRLLEGWHAVASSPMASGNSSAVGILHPGGGSTEHGQIVDRYGGSMRSQDVLSDDGLLLLLLEVLLLLLLLELRLLLGRRIEVDGRSFGRAGCSSVVSVVISGRISPISFGGAAAFVVSLFQDRVGDETVGSSLDSQTSSSSFSGCGAVSIAGCSASTGGTPFLVIRRRLRHTGQTVPQTPIGSGPLLLLPLPFLLHRFHFLQHDVAPAFGSSPSGPGSGPGPISLVPVVAKGPEILPLLIPVPQIQISLVSVPLVQHIPKREILAVDVGIGGYGFHADGLEEGVGLLGGPAHAVGLGVAQGGGGFGLETGLFEGGEGAVGRSFGRGLRRGGGGDALLLLLLLLLLPRR